MEEGGRIVTVNGRDIPVGEGATALDVVKSMGFDIGRIAVEIDGGICPRAQLGDRRLSGGEVLEVVSFVGGGRWPGRWGMPA